MSLEENKALLRRVFEEAMNKGNLSVIDELIAPNYVNYSLPLPTPGPEGFKQIIGMFRSGFPYFNITIDDEFAEGDKVGTRGTWHGTHRGEFMGIAPTGKEVTVAYIDIWRVENGKFVENWVQMDMMGLMQQLGVVPAPGQAAA